MRNVATKLSQQFLNKINTYIYFVVANFGTVVLHLNIGLQGYCIGMLELFISRIKSLIGTTTHLTILDEQCVCKSHEIAELPYHHRQEHKGTQYPH